MILNSPALSSQAPLGLIGPAGGPSRKALGGKPHGAPQGTAHKSGALMGPPGPTRRSRERDLRSANRPLLRNGPAVGGSAEGLVTKGRHRPFVSQPGPRHPRTSPEERGHLSRERCPSDEGRVSDTYVGRTSSPQRRSLWGST